MKNNSVNRDLLTKRQPKLRFKGFSDEYVCKTFNEIFEINVCGDLKFPFIQNKENEYVYPIFSNSANEKDIYGYAKKSQFTADSITITARGDIGKVIYRNQNFCGIGRLLVLKSKCAINKYLYYSLCKSFSFFKELTSVPQLTKPKIINSILFISENLDEQSKIAKFLSLLDKQIELYVSKLALTEKRKKWFLNNINLDIDTNSFCSKIEIIDGFPFNSRDYTKKGIPIYTISNIGNNEFLPSEYNYVNGKIDNKYRLNKNDIFCSLTGEKGFKCLMYDQNNENYINQRTIKIFSSNIDHRIILLYLNLNISKINSFATGSQKNISKKDICRLPLVLNNKNNLIKAIIFFNYLNLAKYLKNKISLLSKIKKYYLNSLFL